MRLAFSHASGVGRFTILDSENVQPLDQGSNFFVGPEHVGLSRAKVVLVRMADGWSGGSSERGMLPLPRCLSAGPLRKRAKGFVALRKLRRTTTRTRAKRYPTPIFDFDTLAICIRHACPGAR